jgi:putative transposase
MKFTRFASRRSRRLPKSSAYGGRRNSQQRQIGIDCCTREIVAWSLELRCRTHEAVTLVSEEVAAAASTRGEITLGTDSGSAFTSRGFRTRLAELRVTHRRGGYRDSESQAFIASWFGKFKQLLRLAL